MRFPPNLLCNMYVTLCVPMVPVWGFWSEFFGLYCPNVTVFLVCGGTWRCEHTLFCMEIVKRHPQIFIHSFTDVTYPLNVGYRLKSADWSIVATCGVSCAQT